MKHNKGREGKNEIGKHPPTSSLHLQRKLEILHLITELNIQEISDNYAHTLRSEDMIYLVTRELASLGIRTEPEGKERVC